jgi:hypothetical protein
MTTQTLRAVSDIASDIRQHMPTGTMTRIFCRPYIEAMGQLLTWEDNYGAESAHEIGLRFLSNASHWRGPDAARIKAEIRTALGVRS